MHSTDAFILQKYDAALMRTRFVTSHTVFASRFKNSRMLCYPLICRTVYNTESNLGDTPDVLYTTLVYYSRDTTERSAATNLPSDARCMCITCTVVQ